MRRTLAGLMVAAAIAGTAGAAQAAPMVDQSFLGTQFAFGEIGSGSSGESIWAQTFTVGLAGRLTGVSLAIEDGGQTGGTLVVELRTTVSGQPTGSLLASLSFAPEEVPDAMPNLIGSADLFAIDLSAFSIDVNVGDVLAIVLSEPTVGVYTPKLQASDAGGGYAGGQLFSSRGTSFIENGLFDMFFETFVDTDAPSAIPEPASLALMGIGLAGVAAARRRRV